MTHSIIIFFSFFGLSFILKESDIFASVRNLLLRNKYVGTFFYGLLSCYACVGFWSGLIIYLFNFNKFNLFHMLTWGFASSAISLITSFVIEKLNNAQNI